MKVLTDLLTFLAFVLLQLRSGRIIDACVQLIRDNYMIVALPQHNYRLAYAPTKLVRILDNMSLALVHERALQKSVISFYCQLESKQSCQALDKCLQLWWHTSLCIPPVAGVTRESVSLLYNFLMLH